MKGLQSIRRVASIGALALGLGAAGACDGDRTATATYPADPAGVRGFDTFGDSPEETCDGIPALMRWDHLEYGEGGGLSEAERAGACTWYFWPGGDPQATGGSPENARGNPRFWRMSEVRTAEIAEKTGLRVGVNLLAFIDSRLRGERFDRLGVVNDPGCRQATGPDPYGLWLDECEDPYSSGVMGIRLFPNPAFEPGHWDPDRYLTPARTVEDASIEPPYLVGMTCGVCHIAFSPTDPPDDPEHPEWENLAPALGNQYIREGQMFKAGLSEEDFLYWVYETQQPGTSDTSRISVDWINNPNAINSIFSILTDRPRWTETMNDGLPREVPHILKDGADSIGPAGAALRVYVNIGLCPDYRMSLEDTFTGLETQQPFVHETAERDCLDWRLTAARMGEAAAFLDSIGPYHLADAPGGEAYLTASEEELELGRRVFGGHCARCHSSKLPPGYSHQGPEKHSAAARADWIELALRDDFLENNFLSDDRRYPLVSDDPRFAIGTNAARALATNAVEGHIWERFSSETYKELPSPGTLHLDNPFSGESDIEHEIPAGGPGYYRTPSLISVWATAPLLHNNLLGRYTGDPSVAGRMEAFEDAMEKLLWPETRLGKDSIKVTPRDTVLRFRSLEVEVPAGTPVNLLAHIDLRELVRKDALLDRLEQLLEHPERLVRLVEALEGRGRYDEELRALVPELLALNQAPDFIEDHGHDSHFGELTDAEKRALIELMKTF
ncbi:MAG: hypothetical protein PVG07_08160 [Acidobacteriota bacterium]|jgi:hypothetical protein